MTLIRLPLSFLLVSLGGALALACTPGSLKLGDDTATSDSDSDSDSDSGTDSDSDSGTDTEDLPDGGSVAWSTMVDDAGFTVLALADDGTFYVAGGQSFAPDGDFSLYTQLWFARFAADGSMLWQILEPVDMLEPPRFVTGLDIAPDGGLLATIRDESAVEGGDNALRKFAPDGTTLWKTTLPGQANAVAATLDGGAVVGGSLPAGDHGVAWAQRLDGEGTPGWGRTWGDPELDVNAVQALAIDGDTVVVGGRLGIEPMTQESLGWLHRAELASGEPVWDRVVTAGLAADAITDLAITNDGQIIAGGVEDALFVRGFDAQGLDLWSVAHGFDLSALGVAGDGSFVVIGNSYADLPATSARIIRYAADQTPQWAVELPPCEFGEAAAITPGGQVLTLAKCGAALGINLLEP
ncbi:MAG: hypothetical protein R3B09_19490 [Nannocystaceae bacterium]